MSKNLNDLIAKNVTIAFGSMYCAYAFLVLALIPVFEPSMMQAIAFVSSSVIQLVALPIILVGSRVLSDTSEKRAKADHAMLIAELAEIRAMHDDLHRAIGRISGKRNMDVV